jgi:hypothetical protein
MLNTTEERLATYFLSRALELLERAKAESDPWQRIDIEEIRASYRAARIIDLDWPCVSGIVLWAFPSGGILAVSYS